MNKWSSALDQIDAPKVMPVFPSSPAVPASFWRRAAAWSLDLIPFQVLAVLIIVASAPSVGTINDLPAWLAHVSTVMLLVGLIYSAYHIVLEHEFQTTLGKWLVGCAVHFSSSVHAPSWATVFIRYGACVLSWALLNVGHAFMVWRRDKKSLHDILTSTQVLRDNDTVLFGRLSPSMKWQRMWMTFGIVFQVVVGIVFLVLGVSALLKMMQALVVVP